jgi:uncharacterized protein (TIGR02118 family)
MTKLVVLYGPPTDTAAFDDHYQNTHVPLAQNVPGLRRFEHGKVLGTGDGSEPPYYWMAELSFDDADALQSGLASPEGQAAGEDAGRVATGGVTMLVVDG